MVRTSPRTEEDDQARGNHEAAEWVEPLLPRAPARRARARHRKVTNGILWKLRMGAVEGLPERTPWQTCTIGLRAARGMGALRPRETRLTRSGDEWR